MPMHASVRRLLAHFNYVDPRSPALCAHFAADAECFGVYYPKEDRFVLGAVL